MASQPPSLSADRVERAKPRAGCWFLTIPIFMVAAVFAAYGYLLYHGFQGRSAAGPLVELGVRACPEAAPVLQARLDLMGLPDVQVHSDRVVLRLTGDANTDADVPLALAMPGVFEVHDTSGAPLAQPADIEEAGYRLDLLAQPHTFVRVAPDAASAIRAWQEAHPNDEIRFVLDGETVGSQENMPAIGDAELEIHPWVDDDGLKMRLAVNRGIAIAHPLPCEVSLAVPRQLDEVPDAP